MVAYLKCFKSTVIEITSKMFKVHVVEDWLLGYDTSKNNFVNSIYHYKELDALTGKRINSVT